MKKIKYIILLLLLLFPITIYAKTPNKEETLKVIEQIENIQVEDNSYIKNISIGEDKFTLIMEINGDFVEKNINYKFTDKGLSFNGEDISIDLKDLEKNKYAFYLYSILENKSTVPYDTNNYYNNSNIKEKINNQTELTKTYIDNSKTFGLTLSKENNKLKITYNYYFDGDYPIIEKEQINSEEFTNPSTRNYSLLITILLISIICIGIYTYLDIPIKRIKGE